MAPDTRSRHRRIAELAGPTATLLDVGGTGGELGLFMPGTRIVTANIEPGADIVYDGKALPFADNEFEVAVSVDVLEHVPKSLRSEHLTELARVARDKVIVCCPLGGEAHDAAERELAEWYEQTTRSRHRYLDEHVQRGLPSEAELTDLARGVPFGTDLFYEGNFVDANQAFRLTTELKQRPTPGRLARYLALILRPDPEAVLERAPTPLTNRAYLIGFPDEPSAPPAAPESRQTLKP